MNIVLHTRASVPHTAYANKSGPTNQPVYIQFTHAR